MRVAAVQLNSTADTAANLAAADRLTHAAAADGARLIVLPEKWTAIGTDEQLRAGAEALDGPAISWARATARELGVDLVAGSIAERRAGSEKLANTCVHVDPQGEIRAVYRRLSPEPALSLSMGHLALGCGYETPPEQSPGTEELHLQLDTPSPPQSRSPA